MVRFNRWYRDPWYVDDVTAGSPRSFWNVQISSIPIQPNFTLERIIGYHRAYIIPVSGDPSVSGAILTIPNTACLVYDDGTDPNLPSANIDYVLQQHHDNILWQRTWTWANLFGFDYIGGLAPGLWDDATNADFDVRAMRRRPADATTNAYLRYVAAGHWAPGHELPREFHPRLALSVLVTVPA